MKSYMEMDETLIPVDDTLILLDEIPPSTFPLVNRGVRTHTPGVHTHPPQCHPPKLSFHPIKHGFHPWELGYHPQINNQKSINEFKYSEYMKQK